MKTVSVKLWIEICPFCGGTPTIESDNKIFARKFFENYPAGHSVGFRIRCDKCGCQTCWWHYENEALKAWNTRQALADNADKVKKVLEEIDSLIMYGVLDNPRFLKEQIKKIFDFKEAVNETK